MTRQFGTTRQLRWIRPVVAGVLTLVLAATGVLVGVRVAGAESPASTAAAIETAEATIVDALPAGVETTLDGADVTALDVLTSPDGSSVTVPLGADETALAAGVEGFTDAIIGSPDPAGAGPAALIVAGLVAPADPCALEGAPADCPAGVTGELRSPLRGGLNILRVVSQGAAATQDTGRLGAACPGTGTGLALVLETTMPVKVEFLYNPYPALTPVLTARGQTADEDREAWVARATGSPLGADWPTVFTCVPTVDLEPDMRYTAQFTITTEGLGLPFLDETSSGSFPFHSRGELIRPPVSIFASADDVVTATVPHNTGETVTFQPHVFYPGETPQCDAAPTELDSQVRPLGNAREWTRSIEETLERGYLEMYRPTVTQSFAINEGLSVLLCIEVLDDRGQPNYSASAVVRTRDRLLPRFTVWSIANSGDDEFELAGVLQNGQPCGFWRTPTGAAALRVLEPEKGLCDFRSIWGTAGSEASPPAGRFVPLSSGVLGSYTIAVRPNGGGDPVATRMVDLSSIASCYGGCPLPPDRYYPIQWNDSDDHPSAAIVRLEWTQGNANGAARTTVTGITDSEMPTPVYPQLDVAAAQVSFVGSDADGWHQIQVPIRVDREALVKVDLIAAPGSGPICLRPGAVTHNEFNTGGRVEGWSELLPTYFDGLCPGSDYQVIVTLIGATSGSGASVWGGDPSRITVPAGAWYAGDWGSGSRYHVPEQEVRLSMAWQLTDEGDRGGASEVGILTHIAIDDGQDLVGPGFVACMPSTQYTPGSFVYTVRVGEVIRVSGSLQRLDGCRRDSARATAYPIPFVAFVSLRELRSRPSGVEIEISEYGLRDVDGYAGQVHGRLLLTLLG